MYLHGFGLSDTIIHATNYAILGKAEADFTFFYFDLHFEFGLLRQPNSHPPFVYDIGKYTVSNDDTLFAIVQIDHLLC